MCAEWEVTTAQAAGFSAPAERQRGLLLLKNQESHGSTGQVQR